MRIKNRKNRLKTLGLLLVLALALFTLLKLDSSLKVFAANTTPATTSTVLPDIPQNPLPDGTVTSSFGERINPITEKWEHHNGVDIAAEEGTPIQLVLDGTVVEVGENEVYGKYVLVQHEGDTYTKYCHLSKTLVKTDYKLKKGELVAFVGSTGWSTGPHLHFEIISNGKYCDPEWFLQW